MCSQMRLQVPRLRKRLQALLERAVQRPLLRLRPSDLLNAVYKLH